MNTIAPAAGPAAGTTATATAAPPAVLEQYQAGSKPGTEADTEKNGELGQDEFLKLMIAQVKHQDPMKPMENGEFIAELAQFSTVSGIEQMQKSLEDLAGSYGASQTLQASQLVGREVLVEADSATLAENGSVEGRLELEAGSGSVTLSVLDPAGQLVRRQTLGELAAGRHDFAWDGLDDKGDPAPAGQYTLSIEATSGDETVAVPAMLARTIDSVEFGAGGNVLLNASDGESLELADVRQIRQSATSQNDQSGTES